MNDENKREGGYNYGYRDPEETHYGYYSGGSYNRPNGNGYNGGNQDDEFGKMNQEFDSRYNGSRQHGNNKKTSLGKKLAIALLCGIIFGVCAGTTFYGFKEINTLLHPDGEENAIKNPIEEIQEALNPEKEEAQAAPEAPAETEEKQVTTVVTDVTAVVDKVMPAVVQVTNTGTVTAQNFWGQQFTQESQSAGSGIIVKQTDSELLIVTNYHVISDADTLTITFNDEEKADALVKGYDSEKDLAVVAIPLENIKAETKSKIAIAELGDSDKLKVGEPAIAIGNAMGYGQSVTTGVISAIHRKMDMTNTDFDLIQTDAAINPGNSGGALLNISGQVIGINSNKIGGAIVEGMGYAIPISEARPIIESLMGKETRSKVEAGQESYLGISGINVTDEVSKAYGLPKGIYIGQVYENTGAAKAGLVQGDVIVKFDDTGITTMEELQKKLKYYPAGTTVNVTVKRGNGQNYQEFTVPVTLGNKSDMDFGSSK